MPNQIQTGQPFQWSFADGRSGGEAVVTSSKTDQQQGLSPEAEDYIALWIEATGTSGLRSGQSFEILLAVDGKSYLDGQAITVTLRPPA